MRILVLCVDRDDDIGVKTGIVSPIIGREENLKAGVALGLADPEDSDTNTIFAAISLYDDFVKRDIDVEIATICGDTHVGFQSDQILGAQVEEVLEEVQPDSTVLVTDGAEDEYIFPVISSRVRIDNVKRVLVNQSAGIESTFYLITKNLQDEKIRKKILTPIALLLLVYGVIAFTPPLVGLIIWRDISFISDFGLPGVAITLGCYLLLRGYNVGNGVKRLLRKIAVAYQNLKRDIISGDVSVIFSTVAVIVVIISIFLGVDAALKGSVSLTARFLQFFRTVILWLIGGVLIHQAGRVTDAFLKKGRVPGSFWIVTVFLIAMGLIVLALADSMALILGFEQANLTTIISIEISLALGITIVGALLHHSMRESKKVRDSWRQ